MSELKVHELGDNRDGYGLLRAMFPEKGDYDVTVVVPLEEREGRPYAMLGACKRNVQVPLEAVVKAHVIAVLLSTKGNQRQAARILGITRWTLARKLKKYGVDPHSLTGPRTEVAA